MKKINQKRDGERPSGVGQGWPGQMALNKETGRERSTGQRDGTRRGLRQGRLLSRL